MPRFAEFDNFNDRADARVTLWTERRKSQLNRAAESR
jgi:hypothetical protein